MVYTPRTLMKTRFTPVHVRTEKMAERPGPIITRSLLDPRQRSSPACQCSERTSLHRAQKCIIIIILKEAGGHKHCTKPDPLFCLRDRAVGPVVAFACILPSGFVLLQHLLTTLPLPAQASQRCVRLTLCAYIGRSIRGFPSPPAQPHVDRHQHHHHHHCRGQGLPRMFATELPLCCER